MKTVGDQYVSVGRMTLEMLQKSCGSQVTKVFSHSWGKKLQERNECQAQHHRRETLLRDLPGSTRCKN